MNPSPDYLPILRELVSAVNALAKKEWTEPAVILTALSLFLIAVTTVMSFTIMKAAQKQAESAQKQVDAAHDQVAAAHKAISEAQKQHRLEVRPVVVLEAYQSESTGHRMRVRNVGRGPAFHAQVAPIRQTDATIEFAEVQFVEAKGRESMWFKAYMNTTDKLSIQESGIFNIFQLVRSGSLTKPFDLALSYEDLYGTSGIARLSVESSGSQVTHFTTPLFS